MTDVIIVSVRRKSARVDMWPTDVGKGVQKGPSVPPLYVGPCSGGMGGGTDLEVPVCCTL